MMKPIALAAVLLLSSQAMSASSSALATISVMPSFNTEETNQLKNLKDGDVFLSKNRYASTLQVDRDSPESSNQTKEKDSQAIDLIY